MNSVHGILRPSGVRYTVAGTGFLSSHIRDKRCIEQEAGANACYTLLLILLSHTSCSFSLLFNVSNITTRPE